MNLERGPNSAHNRGLLRKLTPPAARGLKLEAKGVAGLGGVREYVSALRRLRGKDCWSLGFT